MKNSKGNPFGLRIGKLTSKIKKHKYKQSPGAKKLSAKMRAMDPSTPEGRKKLFSKK